MAKQKRKKSRSKKKQQRQQMLIIGALLVFFGLFALLKLGFLGTMIANVFRIIVGNTYPLLAAGTILYGAVILVKQDVPTFKHKEKLWGVLLLYLGVLLFLHTRMFAGIDSTTAAPLGTTWRLLFTDIKANAVQQAVGGGMLGALLYSATNFLVAQIGSYLIAVLLVIAGALVVSPIDAHQLADGLQHIGTWFKGASERSQARQAQRSAARAEKKAAEDARIQQEAEARLKNTVRPMTPGEQLAQEEQEAIIEKPQQMELPIIDSFQQARAAKPMPVEQVADELEEMEGELEFEIKAEEEDRDYQLPPSTLLDTIPATDQSDEYQKIERNIGVLEQTFKSFGVDAKVVKASLGPAVTKFEVQPAVGVKVSKIVGLTDDIALALAAKDVRMEAPIPGKSLIGIEVPNNKISMVSFRDVIESQPSHPDKLLEVPLGRDISGMVQSADLTKMPHMLIAGSTGSGKSVCINGIITSILMRAKPHEVKLMMIDPKMVELNVYNGIPHLLTPVVTNPRKASQALHKVVQEMERRYELFAASGVRNITGYNEMVADLNANDGENRPILPFIVVVVDELADLMMVASNEVEDAIIRLAQMARAAGIHMILATQRPSVDVITGIIKANVPSRIAFAVSSGTDSRTIIDSNGAEKLLGRGDMLFLPMGENKAIRIQGAFISDHEVERVVSFVTDQQEADYQEDMMPSEEPETVAGEASQDELYEDAKAMVVEMQTASISLLQRRFRIGYNRAARLIDELEANQVIGPSEGSKPRQVYAQPEPEE